MMRLVPRSVRSRRGGPTAPHRTEGGFLSLEWVLTVPVMVLLAALVVAAGYVIRDVLVLQEAARVGARIASTTAGDAPITAAVHDAAPELGGGLSVAVIPQVRQPGDQVEVVVATTRTYGPISHRLRARSTARVEPTLEDSDATSPIDPTRPFDPPTTAEPWS